MFVELLDKNAWKEYAQQEFHEKKKLNFCLLQIGVEHNIYALPHPCKLYIVRFSDTRRACPDTKFVILFRSVIWNKMDGGGRIWNKIWPLLTKERFNFPTIAHILLRTAKKSLSNSSYAPNRKQNIWLVEIAANQLLALDFEKFLRLSWI